MEGNRILGAGIFARPAVSAILGAGDDRTLRDQIDSVSRAEFNALPAAIASFQIDCG
jgi:hypothetical protein